MEIATAPHSETADWISTLPDELLRLILIAADLDMKSTVATSAVSKRWRSLWKSCLTKLHFHIPNDHHEWNSFRASVEALLLSICSNNEYSDEDLVLLSLSTNGLIAPYMFDLLGRIFTHGVANRVRTFRLEIGLHGSFSPVPPGLIALCSSVESLELSHFGNLRGLESNDFPVLRRLRLENCFLWPPTVGRLARRFTDGPRGRVFKVMFDGFPNLTKLELVRCEFRILPKIDILCGDNLEELVMVWPTEPRYEFRYRMMVRAPKVKSFTCKEMKATWLKSFEFPLLECLDIDAYAHFIEGKDLRRTSRKVFGHLRKFSGLKLVKLHPRTIEVLTMVPGLLEAEESPFTSMECVEFHNCGSLISNRGVFNDLVSYFFDHHIQGSTALFDRVLAQLGGGGGSDGDGSSQPEVVVVYKTDLVLTMVSGLLELEKSPFKSMECVEFHNCGGLISNWRVFNALISYLFGDCIQRRTTLFVRVLAQLGRGVNGDDGSSRPVVVYKRDLVFSLLASPFIELSDFVA